MFFLGGLCLLGEDLALLGADLIFGLVRALGAALRTFGTGAGLLADPVDCLGFLGVAARLTALPGLPLRGFDRIADAQLLEDLNIVTISLAPVSTPKTR